MTQDNSSAANPSVTDNAVTSTMKQEEEQNCAKSSSLVVSDTEEEESVQLETSEAPQVVKSTKSRSINLDLIIYHEDFSKILALAVKIQKACERILKGTGQPWVSKQSLPKNSASPEKVLKVVLRLQDRWMSNPEASRGTIRRGENPSTDIILERYNKLLVQEVKDMFRLFVPSSATKRGFGMAQQQCCSDATDQTSSSRKRQRVEKCDEAIQQPQVTENEAQSSNTSMEATTLVPKSQSIESSIDVNSCTTISNAQDYYLKCEDGDAELLKEFSDVWLTSTDPENHEVASATSLSLTGDVTETHRPNKRPRVVSPMDDLDLGEEDMETWANQFGLSLE